ncbi:hypothetical protein HN51_014076 [Arachis hypogaea]|uniref:Uncharacterized protein n=1 Tax=Arachis hypogaea TaxID=3818 RepID=A0A445DMK3_ARAHY|nr:uncharacterized protein LOC107631615 [Arachis ipaensis]XP_025639580.1 uncharacterized protein LOC112734467 [Arachis hypogaea]QHO59952.1 zinc finger protein, C3H1 type-like [Arachis hypogaea]RYR64427.1 hypothetical protein Ahy_A03g010533 [Arachis hypogaea]
MESARSGGKMKASKVKASNENLSPLQKEMDDQRGRYLQSLTMSPRLQVQPFAENIDVGSPLARYLFAGSPSGKSVTRGDAFTSPTYGSGKYKSSKSSGSSSYGPRSRLSLSPLSSVENLEIAPMYRTPVKVDEEVLVMDDILVRSTSGGKSGRSSSSSGRGSSSSSSSSPSPWVKNAFKTEGYKAWDESGNCRSNAKSQSGYEKEEVHQTRLSMKAKLEAQAGKSSLSAGSDAYGSNSRTVQHHNAAAECLGTTSQPASPVKPEPPRTLAHAYPNTLSDWSPLDDGMIVFLGSDIAASKEEVDSYISSVLYGHAAKRRLPVFVELCKKGIN